MWSERKTGQKQKQKQNDHTMKPKPKYNIGDDVTIPKQHLPEGAPRQDLHTHIKKRVFLKKDALTPEGWRYWITDKEYPNELFREENIVPNTTKRIEQSLRRYDNGYVSLMQLRAELSRIGVTMRGLEGLKGNLLLKYHENGQSKELQLK